jgi:hypothetical protein
MSLMTAHKSDLLQCVAKGVNFLDEHQLYNGEFRSYLANDESIEGTSVIVYGCTFVPLAQTGLKK